MNVRRPPWTRHHRRIGALAPWHVLAMVALAIAAWPFTAMAACTGPYADMQSYAGKIMYDTHFLTAPLVATRLRQLPFNVQRGIDHAFLRINGDMQGTISLENSTAATQAALGRCYRY